MRMHSFSEILMEFDMKSSKLSGNPGLCSNKFSFKTDLGGHISLIDTITQIEVDGSFVSPLYQQIVWL